MDTEERRGKVRACLEFMSLGKFSHGIYFKRKRQHSTVVGGVLTLGVMLLLLTISISILIKVFNQEDFQMDSNLMTMEQLGFEDLTINDWVDAMGITQFSVFIDKDFNCSEDLRFSIIYNR